MPRPAADGPEIEVTANLRHLNLLALFESGGASGLLYDVLVHNWRGSCGRPRPDGRTARGAAEQRGG